MAKYRVRDGFVFVTFDKEGKRQPEPNIGLLDDSDPKMRPFILQQMHKLEEVDAPAKRKAAKDAKKGADKKEEKKPARKPARNRPGRRGRASTRK